MKVKVILESTCEGKLLDHYGEGDKDNSFGGICFTTLQFNAHIKVTPIMVSQIPM